MKNTNPLALFGVVWAASGAQGTFGEGYKLNWIKRLGGMCYLFVTSVMKTVTAEANFGNTPLEADGFSVKERMPKSVWITPWSWLHCYCLNCFGLSNGGIAAALRTGKWQARWKPFMISFMPVGDKSTWLDQTRKFVKLMQLGLRDIHTTVALQANFSCPNTGKDPLELAPFMKEILDILCALGIPILVKINAQFPVALAKEISKHPAVTGFIMGNTIPFGGKLPDGFPQIPWVKIFGTDDPKKSPLALRFGGDPSKAGGYSGKELLDIHCHWTREARKVGITCHINIGGGIYGPLGALKAWRSGADSISLGMINSFRPWMMLPTTVVAHILFRLFPRKVQIH